jgi:hypothetical protein
MGAAPDESKARYNQAIQGGSPILALNHETHGMFSNLENATLMTKYFIESSVYVFL